MRILLRRHYECIAYTHLKVPLKMIKAQQKNFLKAVFEGIQKAQLNDRTSKDAQNNDVVQAYKSGGKLYYRSRSTIALNRKKKKRKYQLGNVRDICGWDMKDEFRRVLDITENCIRRGRQF